MSFWTWTAIVVIPAAVSILFTLLTTRFARASRLPSVLGGLEGNPRPCYRCGEAEAMVDYMGLHYCLMCQVMVARMNSAVRQDPPFGFPGASGYLEFPAGGPSGEKKEKIHG